MGHMSRTYILVLGEKRGLQVVATNDDLVMVFQKFQTCKKVSFVVEFPIKHAYKSSMILESKLEKLPVRRNPNLSQESSSSAESSDESGDEIEENVHPSWMDDEDVFMEDHEVFVSLGLRAEDEAARLNLGHDGIDLNAGEAEFLVDDSAENEPRFIVDKDRPKIRKGETFPCMVDFRMALRQYAILNEFEVHKVITDKKRYRVECKANGCSWSIVANKLVGQPTIEITMISHEHDCMGTAKLVSKMMFPDIDMATFVHDYCIIERFRTAYSGSIPHMTDKSQWPEVDMGFKLLPPPLKRVHGRQTKNRFTASREPGARKQQRCNKYGEFEHRANGNCPLKDTKKRKKKVYPKRQPKKAKTIPADTISPGSLTRRIVNLVHEDDEIGISSGTISAKRLLVLSQDQGGEIASKEAIK